MTPDVAGQPSRSADPDAGRLDVREVWRETLRVAGLTPLVLMVPAFAVAALADLLTLSAGHDVAEAVIAVADFVVFEIYVAYAEHVLVELERGDAPVSLRAVAAGTAVNGGSILAAAVPAAVLEVGASGLLLVPGLWLLTRWSLAASVIASEQLGPLQALRRSNALVRGRTAAVFATATVAALAQTVALDVTAIGDHPLFGSLAVALAVSALVAAIITPPAAIITSVVYSACTSDAAIGPAD